MAGGRMMEGSPHCRGDETEGCGGKVSCAVRMKTPGDRPQRKENSGVEREEGKVWRGRVGQLSAGRQGAWGAERPFLPVYPRSPWLGLNSGARKVLYTEL